MLKFYLPPFYQWLLQNSFEKKFNQTLSVNVDLGEEVLNE